MKLKITLSVLTLISQVALADDLPWTVNGGMDYRSSKFTLPGSAYKRNEWTVNTSLTKKIDPLTSIGGIVSYNKNSTDYTSNFSNPDGYSTSFGIFLQRYFEQGLFGDAYIGYGKSIVDYNTNNVAFSAEGNSTIAAVGLIQVLPISNTISANLSARLTAVHSKNNSYVTGSGITVAAYNPILNFATLGGRVDWRVGKLSPYIHLDWNRADSEFQSGTNSKDYFGYGIGISATLSPKTSIFIAIRSVFGKAYSDELSTSINLNHRF